MLILFYVPRLLSEVIWHLEPTGATVSVYSARVISLFARQAKGSKLSGQDNRLPGLFHFSVHVRPSTSMLIITGGGGTVRQRAREEGG